MRSRSSGLRRLRDGVLANAIQFTDRQEQPIGQPGHIDRSQLERRATKTSELLAQLDVVEGHVVALRGEHAHEAAPDPRWAVLDELKFD